jgi:hypothetical protein
VERQNPLLIRDFAAFQNRAVANRELFAAVLVIALVATLAVCLALHGGIVALGTMRADWTLGPAKTFQVFAALFFGQAGDF